MAELRQSRRVRGLPPDFTPGSGENPMEAIDQGVATTSQVGENVVVESRVPYPSLLAGIFHLLRTARCSTHLNG